MSRILVIGAGCSTILAHALAQAGHDVIGYNNQPNVLELKPTPTIEFIQWKAPVGYAIHHNDRPYLKRKKGRS